MDGEAHFAIYLSLGLRGRLAWLCAWQAVFLGAEWIGQGRAFGSSSSPIGNRFLCDNPCAGSGRATIGGVSGATVCGPKSADASLPGLRDTSRGFSESIAESHSWVGSFGIG